MFVVEFMFNQSSAQESSHQVNVSHAVIGSISSMSMGGDHRDYVK